MNDKGQFLLFDALLSIFMIFIVIIAMFYILNQEKEFIPDNTEVIERLNLISSSYTGDKNILIGVEENDSNSKAIVEDMLSDKKYSLYDITLNQTILGKYDADSRNAVSSKKVIGDHEFILTFYY